MPDGLSSLGDDDVRQLIQVIESLEHSAFDFLELEVGGMRVVLGKGNPADYPGATRASAPSTPAAPPAPVAVPAAATPQVAPSAPSAPVPISPSPTPTSPAAPSGNEGTVEVLSPIVGLYYAQPEPGAPPFVVVGGTVAPDTTVGLVEMMKMFNAVPAGVAGTVVEILVEDAQTVEYGQPLIRVRPA